MSSKSDLDESIISKDSIEKETPSNYIEEELSRLRELIDLKISENLSLETKLNECEQQANLKIDKLNHDFTLKLEQTLQTFQEGQRDQQSSLVMKYAAGEKKCIELNRNIDFLQSKLTDSDKEKKNLNEKLNKVKQDLEKITVDYDKKCQDFLFVKKECDKLKADLVLNEAREKANLIKMKQEVNEVESQKCLIDEKQYEAAVKDLNSLKSKVNDLNEERTTLKDRLKCMDQERIRQDILLKESVSDLDHLKIKIEKEKKDKAVLKDEIANLQTEMKLNQDKQNDLLSFASKLTEKNTLLQTENKMLEEKIEQMQTDSVKQDSNESIESIRNELNLLNKRLLLETNKTKFLEDSLKLKEKLIEELSTKLSDEQAEIVTLKKKHANNVKDLTRQLQQMQKKTLFSPANSTSSFDDKIEKINYESSLIQTRNSISEDDAKTFSDETSLGTSHYSEVICGYNEDVYVVDVDKQKLIDKIVNLQDFLAKKNEKIDFLKDHVNQLTIDLKRKTKIIQAYAMNQEAGMFTSETHDNIKRQMSRKVGGLMSAFYFNSTNEANVTVEINNKLQALLEDTLIKNITLKENVETLGQEISRLSLKR